MYAIQSSTDIGKINDCKISESNSKNAVSTLAVCTSLGFIKIFNIQTTSELFSLKVARPNGGSSSNVNLNKLHYTLSYIITVDQSGYVYFIDLQQVNNNSNGFQAENSDNNSKGFKTKTNSFLSHTIKLCSNSLQTLCIYKDMIVCVGDSEGTLYFLSLVDI